MPFSVVCLDFRGRGNCVLLSSYGQSVSTLHVLATNLVLDVSGRGRDETFKSMFIFNVENESKASCYWIDFQILVKRVDLVQSDL